MSRIRRLVVLYLDWFPVMILLLFGVLYLLSIPQTFILFDALHEWQLAWHSLSQNKIPTVGSKIGGMGANGPAATLLNVALLKLYFSEWTSPVVGGVLALITATGVWAYLRRRIGWQNASWAVAIVATNPFLAEWARSGLDVAYVPLVSLPLIVLFPRVFKTNRFGSIFSFLFGLVFAIGCQFHVSLFPLALVSGFFLFVHNPRGSAFMALGFFLPYLGTMGNGGLTTSFLQYDSLPSIGNVLWRLVFAQSIDFYQRLDFLGMPLPALGGVTAMIPWIVLFFRGTKREPGVAPKILFWSAILAILLLSFPEKSHYHHILHLYGTIAAIHLYFALWTIRKNIWFRKLPAALMLATNLLLFSLQTNHSVATGDSILANVFPVSQTGMMVHGATLESRTEVQKFVTRFELDTPLQRATAITGPAALSFLETGWFFLSDLNAEYDKKENTPKQSYFFGPCASNGIRVNKTTCINPTEEYKTTTLFFANGETINTSQMNRILWPATRKNPDPRSFSFPQKYIPVTFSTEGARTVVVRELRWPEFAYLSVDPRQDFVMSPTLVQDARLLGYMLQEHHYSAPETQTIISISAEGRLLLEIALYP